MAKTAYEKTALLGNTASSLDGIDGTGLLDGDFAFVFDSGSLYHFILDDDAASVEDSPNVITPDANAGNKRWILAIPPVAAGGTGATTATASLDNLSPMTTKGDLIGFTTTSTRIAACATDDHILITDATNAHGFRYKASAASSTTAGMIEIATYAEVQAGTVTNMAVTPNTLATKVASPTTPGIIRIATYAETNTGTAATVGITPARLAQKVASATTPGIIRMATYAEVNAGTSTTTGVSPARLFGRKASLTTIGLIELATSAEAAAGTDVARAVTPGALASSFMYDTISVMAGSFVPGTTASASWGSYEYATNDVARDYYAFDKDSDEYIRFTIPMPEGWDQSTFKAKFYWTAASTAATINQTVVWKIGAGLTKDGTLIDKAFGTAASARDLALTLLNTRTHISPATGAITPSGTASTGGMLDFYVYRDISEDSLACDAWLFGVVLQYKRNRQVLAW